MEQSGSYLDIDFLVSSVPIDSRIYDFLSQCDPKNPKIDAILLRIYRREFSQPAVDWTIQKTRTSKYWKMEERELQLLRNQVKELDNKQKARAARLSLNLFLLYVRKGSKWHTVKECEDLIVLLEKYK